LTVAPLRYAVDFTNQLKVGSSNRNLLIQHRQIETATIYLSHSQP